MPSNLPAEPPPTGAPPAPPAEPSVDADRPPLGARLARGWTDAPLVLRVGGLGVLLALVAWAALREPLAEVPERPAEEDWTEAAARARAEYAAMLRQSPAPLAGAAAGALEPGDAERSDDRYADYYAFDADSAAFSVLVTSGEFAPDLAVRLPDGRPVAASDLLRTAGRAEIDGLRGPGRFSVAVTSREPRAGGAYEVEVVPAGPVDSVVVDGAGVEGALGGGPRRAGRYERALAVAAGPEAPVVLRVVSRTFAPRVHLFGPNGEVGDGWRTVERLSSGDSLHAVVVRYLPGWDAPYRLLVTSEAPGVRGRFAVDARTVPIGTVGVPGRASGALGDESWLEDGRYVDTYRLRVQDAERLTLRAESDEVPPALRLWRVERRSREAVAEDLNGAGASAVEVERELEEGLYYVEVLSGGDLDEGEPALGGPYTLTVEAERPDPPEGAPGVLDGPVPGSRFVPVEVRRTGESGGSTFEVGVTGVAVSYPGGSRTRVQLSVSVRSVDYAGAWAPWSNFARKAYLVDGGGRRYPVSVGESRSPSGPEAEPGTVRRGTVVFYAPEVVRDISRLVFVPSIGERTLTLLVPMR